MANRLAGAGDFLAQAFYVTGGTLPHDAPSYVERAADSALYDGLSQGEFCYVLTARQMGKSSLMVRTAARLRSEGVAAAVLDLTAVGQNVSASQWYDGLLYLLSKALGFEEELEAHWFDKERLGPMQRWMEALSDIALKRVPGRIVLFIDEIDTVRSLPFSVDEFFAAIRECYNRRSEDPEFKRLTFCLLGVARPSDLIRDTRTTPFNIGRRIELTDFTDAEAAHLADGLAGDDPAREDRRRHLLQRILHWTSGHPYLTQRLCQATARDAAVETLRDVDRLCSELFFSPGSRDSDDNLQFVRERMLRSEVDLAALLTMYRRIHGGRVVVNDETDPLGGVLKLSGIVRVCAARSDGLGRLVIRNRIYEQAFDQGWAVSCMPEADVRRQKAAFRRGVARASLVSGIVLLVLGALGIVAYQEARRARKAEGRLSAALKSADEKLRDSYLAQAQARRWSGRPGQKFISLAAIAKAAQLPADPEFRLRLRNEAIACMALPVDIRKVARYPFNEDGNSEDDGVPSSRSFATTDPAGVITIRTMENGRVIFRLKGPNAPIEVTRFSPGGRYLVVGYNSRRGLNIWDLQSRSIIWKLPADGFRGFAFLPGDKAAARSTYTGDLIIRNLASGHERTIADSVLPPPNVLRPNHNGKTLAMAATGEKRIRMLDLSTGELAQIDAPKAIGTFAWSADGRSFATTHTEGLEIMVWDLESRTPISKMIGHAALPTQLTFLRGGRLLASGAWDGSLRFWDVRTGRQLLNMTRPSDDYRFSRDEKRLVYADSISTQVFEIDAGEECSVLPHAPNVLCWSADFVPGTSLVTTAASDGVRFWDSIRGDQKGFLRTGPMSQVVVSSGGIALYNGITQTLSVSRIRHDPNTNVVRIEAPGACRRVNDLQSMAVSADGSRIICANRNSLSAYNFPNLKSEVILKPHAGVEDADLSPDGRWASSGGHHVSNLKVWDLKGGVLIRTLPTGNMSASEFSPDGRYLAEGNPVRFGFWNAGSWNLERVIPRASPGGLSGYVAFSDDGRTAALAHTVGVYNLIDPATYALQATLQPQAEYVVTRARRFSPDGGSFLYGTQSGAFYLWNLRLIRDRLSEMGLDWDAPVARPLPTTSRPLRLKIDPSYHPQY